MFDEIINAITQGTPPKTTIKQGPEGSTMTTNIVWDGNQDQPWGVNPREENSEPKNIIEWYRQASGRDADIPAQDGGDGEYTFWNELMRGPQGPQVTWDSYWSDPDLDERWAGEALAAGIQGAGNLVSSIGEPLISKDDVELRENLGNEPSGKVAATGQPIRNRPYMDSYSQRVADRNLGTGGWEDQFRLEANQDSDALRRSLNKQQEAADAEAQRASTAITTAADTYASRFEGYDFAERAKNERSELLRRANRIVTQGFMLDMMAMAMGKDYRGSQAYIEGSLANLETEAQYGNADRLTDMTKALYFKPDGTYDPPQSREEAFEALTMMGADTETAAAISGKIAEGKEYYVKDPSSNTGYRIERSKPKSGEEYTTSATVAGQWGPRSDTSTATIKNLAALSQIEAGLSNPNISESQRRGLLRSKEALMKDLNIDSGLKRERAYDTFLKSYGKEWNGGTSTMAAGSRVKQLDIYNNIPESYIAKITNNAESAFDVIHAIDTGHVPVVNEQQIDELPSGTKFVYIFANGRPTTRVKP